MSVALTVVAPAPADSRPAPRPGRADEFRPADAPAASTGAVLVALPLAAFAQAGQMLATRVPWDPEPLWFVPTPADAETLVAEGVNPGRLWTANALRQLLAAGLTRAGARRIAQARIAFEAEAVVIPPPTPVAPTHEQLTLEAL